MSLFGIGLLVGFVISIVSISIFFAAQSVATGLPAAVRNSGRLAAVGRSGVALVMTGVMLAVAAWSVPGLGLVQTQSLRSAPASVPETHGAPVKSTSAQVSGLDAEIVRIEKYLASVGRRPLPPVASSGRPASSGLPDVETMIASLAKRLEKEPGDVEGWRTLGWSFANTGRPAEAVTALQMAVELAPNRDDLKQALYEARTAAGTPSPLVQQSEPAPKGTDPVPRDPVAQD